MHSLKSFDKHSQITHQKSYTNLHNIPTSSMRIHISLIFTNYGHRLFFFLIFANILGNSGILLF